MYKTINRSYKCEICDKLYSGYQSLWIHNKKYHNNKVIVCGSTTNSKVANSKVANNKIANNKLASNVVSNKIIKCIFCSKIFNDRSNRCKHQKICKNKINIVEENKNIKDEIDNIKIKDEIENKNIKDEIDNIKIISQNKPSIINTHNDINNQLINLIVDQTKRIEDLQTKINTNEETKININEETKININKELPTLNVNNIIVVSRSIDNYINAIQLCQAGNKIFNDWYLLNTTKQLISVLESKTGILSCKLVEDCWIHPDLAIQLAYWISPIFGLQVSEWIRTLFINNVSVDSKLLENKDIEIKLKDQKIKLLENTYLKKHKRTNYLDNVIYIVTTKENRKDRIYIIGKAKSFKDRLSTYNKTAEHEVVYCKQCKSTESLKIIESITLAKLDKYREKANRDRFILPIDKNIDLFTDIVDNCIKFVDDNEISI
jgi:hypothetical protein